MRIHFEMTVDAGWPRRRPRRTTVAAFVLAIGLVVPGAALASHVFNDVSTSNTFHANITNLAGSGITTGCGVGLYCPEDGVTRGQMAAFLNRGLGRIAELDLVEDVTGNGTNEVVSLSITPGVATTSGTQFVKGSFSGLIHLTNSTGCPCQISLTLLSEDSALSPFPISLTTGDTDLYEPISVQGVIEVTGPGPFPVRLMADISDDDGGPTTSYQVIGNLILETFAFGSTGTSDL